MASIKRGATVVMLPVFMVLGACDFVGTENYLSEPADSPIDEQLLGAWIATEESLEPSGLGAGRDAVIVTASRDLNDDGDEVIDISVVQLARKPGEHPAYQWLLVDGHTTRLGDRRFLNLAPTMSFSLDPNLSFFDGGLDMEVEPSQKQILEYWFDEQGRLLLRAMDADYLEAAVEAGRIDADVSSKDFSATVILTGSPEELRAMIEREPADQLFGEAVGYLVRIDSLAPPLEPAP